MSLNNDACRQPYGYARNITNTRIENPKSVIDSDLKVEKPMEVMWNEKENSV